MPLPDDFAIAPGVQALLDLFASEVPALKFPDLDSDVLEDAASRVRVHAAAVERAEAAAETARSMLVESQEELLHKAQRAVAYLRIYAEETPALGPKVEAISLPRLVKRAPPESVASEAPKRRGRPPKVSSATNPLFEDKSGESLEA